MKTNPIDNRTTRTRVAGVLVGVALGLPALAAFGGGHAASPVSAAGAALVRADTGAAWRATLLAPPGGTRDTTVGNVGGVATLTPAGAKQTRADIHVSGAKPGSMLPWHVHRGTCGKDQGIVGPAKTYTPLHIGADGEGEVTVTLPIPPPSGGDYMVNVHKSPSDLKTIVACGNLARA